MKNKPILVVAGDPNSIFFEIFFKAIKKIKIKSPIILICSNESLQKFIKKNNINIYFNFLDKKKILNYELKDSLYIIDVPILKAKKFDYKKNFIENHINESFDVAFRLLKKKITHKLINGPINKKKFFKGKYLGVTEYISDKFGKKKTGMLIYNKNLSVSPLTTHLPLKLVAKNINSVKLLKNIKIIDSFFIKIFKKKPRIAVTGLNPHCESFLNYNEDEVIIRSVISKVKKLKIKIKGPFPADTLFLKNNRKKFDVIIGMYHDQVLAPIKTLYEYDAINITMGLPFLRVSPDHGPNEKMVGKNKSNPLSLIRAIEFLDKT